MLVEEAEWLRGAFARLPDEAFPLLNLGSSTGYVRTVEQPHVQALVIGPLEGRGVRVVHADLKPDEGVDVTLDFTDPADRRRLVGEVGPVGSVLCANMLEHLNIPPAEAAAHLLDLTPPGGWLVVTVPYRFGPHPDPIDNGYRPAPDELADLFGSDADVVDATAVKGPVIAALHASKTGWLRYAGRVAMPWYRSEHWRGLVASAWKPALVSCAVVRRRESGDQRYTCPTQKP